MTGLLNEKSVLITGAGRGIGRVASLVMAREGARLVLTDRDLEAAEETAHQVTRIGATAVTIGGDVSESGEVEAMVRLAVSEFGRLDCAFNNAGIGSIEGARGLKVEDVEQHAWEKIIAINLTGVFLCMQHELRQMSIQGGGSIVNTASIMGLAGLRVTSPYVASKHAVVGLTRTAALEYAQAGIRINAVCPGFTDTPILDNVMKTRGDEVLASVPMKRLATPEEIAETVTFLCSDRASYTTGVAYPVDGGFMAQ